MMRVYLAELNEVCASAVGEPFPARIAVYMGLPGLLREIDALAIPDD
ncbi:hypothetical protein ACIQRC_35030 [Streptomyces californicus]